MKRYLSIALFVLLWPSLLCGQQYVFHSYRQPDGLSNLSPLVIRQDQQGFLWIGTENGLFRFSGSDFDAIGPDHGLPESFISELYIAPDGIIWVGTRENLYRWLGQRFEPVLKKNNLSVTTSSSLTTFGPNQLLLVSGRKLLLLQSADQGKTWDSSSFFSQHELQAVPQLNEIEGIYATPEGDLWMGCGQAICQYSHHQTYIWNQSKGVPEETWSTFLRARNGSLWAQGKHNLLELPYHSTRFLKRTFANDRLDTVYARRPLAEDKNGNILASADNGILRWDNLQWQHIDRANGLSAGHITELFFDEEGDLWMGSSGRGLVHWIGYRNWKHWTSRQGLPDDLIWTEFSNSQNRLYIGTGLGMAILDKTKQKIIPLRDAASGVDGQVGAFVEDKQHNIWAGTFSGALIHIDSRTLKPTRVADLPLIYHLVRDHEDRIWICTNRDLYVLDHPKLGARPRRVDEASAIAANARRVATHASVTQSAGIWFLSDNGLLLYDREQWTRPVIQGLPGHVHLKLLAGSRDNSLWVTGEDGGLWHIRQEGEKSVASPLPIGANLTHAELLAILEDHRGWLWVGTDRGVAAWNGSQWRLINQESGLIWNDTTQDGIREDNDGSIWIATSNGVTHLLRPEEIFHPIRLRTLVTSMERDGTPFPTNRFFTLPWSRESIQFHVGAPSFLNASSLFYRYRLIGLDTKWETTKIPNIRYTALSPGNYRLEITAANNTLDAVADTAIVRFRILPPWWQTNTFYAACLLLISVFIFLLWRWRTRRLLIQQHRLETLVHQRTAELELSQEQLRRQATYDGLTGLLNRTAILGILNEQIERAHREHSSLAVILADLDHFKDINDTYGHLAGDQVLREVSTRLKSNIRPYDYVGRYGGEELLLIFPCHHSQSDPNFTIRLEGLHRCIAGAPISITSQKGDIFDLVVTCSFGVAWLQSENSLTPQKKWAEHILHLSDAALYRAKHLGRNRIEFA